MHVYCTYRTVHGNVNALLNIYTISISLCTHAYPKIYVKIQTTLRAPSAAPVSPVDGTFPRTSSRCLRVQRTATATVRSALRGARACAVPPPQQHAHPAGEELPTGEELPSWAGFEPYSDVSDPFYGFASAAVAEPAAEPALSVS